MSKKTGMIITGIVSVLTLLCCTIPMCIWGIIVFAGMGEWSTDFGPSSQSGTMPTAFGIVPCCLSILVWAVPLLLWLFLVRGKEDAIEEYMEENTAV